MFPRKWAELGWLQAEVVPVFGFGWNYAFVQWRMKESERKNQYDFIAL